VTTASTRSARRRLRPSTSATSIRYRDWPFALAAYNAGEGRVDRARLRYPGASFWQLAREGHLPTTSRHFVPRFFAMVRVSESRNLCKTNGVAGVQQARN